MVVSRETPSPIINLLSTILIRLGVNMENLKNIMDAFMVKGEHSPLPDKVFTPRAKQVLEHSFDEAQGMGHDFIGTEHLLLGILREKNGAAARILNSEGVTYEKVKKQVKELPETNN